ncbi:HEPN/Toprim-associated domain-containing protein [Burkholderia multivorans]|uniref:HEPN/Toprim-associated domain-containing protein n=1 Tax=Burkholderia multivorans TaxID=87883 RepID=UPI0021C124F9|nr:HEPN/Toprim-associated domain-containing protein [Burkholderia multivorans]
MTCSSTITIGGYPLDVMRRSYTLWEYFEKRDRIIRSRRKDQRNPHLQGMPDTELAAQELELDFAYSVTADVLRRRLGRAGFTWTTLEKEFLQYYQAVCRRPGNLFFNAYPDGPEKAHARAEAFRAATLDDWLEALAETVKSGVTRIRRNSQECTQPGNILVEIITGRDEPHSTDLMPRHCLYGFPCSSLENMAVALLEVVSSDAACEQEVTMFVQYQGDTAFDDMRLRKKPRQNLYQDSDGI